MIIKTLHKLGTNIISFSNYKYKKQKQKKTLKRTALINKIVWPLILLIVAVASYFVAIKLISEPQIIKSLFSQEKRIVSTSKKIIAQPEQPEASNIIKSRVRYVVDGDSLYLNNYKPQIRLWGVDAPEKSEAGFSAATKYLTKIAKGQFLKCHMVDEDRYGRTVARCFLLNGNEINRMMLESKTAREYIRFTKGYYKKTRKN